MKLGNADLLRLLPEHISGDPQFAAAGSAINPILDSISRAIPNQLLWARLGGQDPATFLPPLRRLTELRPGLAPLDIDTLEELAWQFHVDFRNVAQDRGQLADMVLNSIAWHRIKGTPASIRAALSLFNFGGIHIDEHDPGMHWATYQLGFDEVASLDDLSLILKICNEMQPARCRLWRVYSRDYDYRPGVWSGPQPQNAWSVSWWSGYSGSYIPELPGLDERGLLVSWGKRLRVLCQGWSEARKIGLWQTVTRYIRAYGRYVPRWSEARWSEFRYQNPISSALWDWLSFSVFNYGANTRIWLDNASWPDEPWCENWRILPDKIPVGFCAAAGCPILPPSFWALWPDESAFAHFKNLEKLPQYAILHSIADLIFAPHTQTLWPDAAWPDDRPWLAGAVNGRIWRAWREQTCVRLIARAYGASWPDAVWPEAIWGDPYANLSGANAAACLWDVHACAAMPPDFAEIWADSSWPETFWDGRWRNLQQPPATGMAATLAVIALDMGLTGLWQDWLWPDLAWLDPKTVGRPALFAALQSRAGEIDAQMTLAPAVAAWNGNAFAAPAFYAGEVRAATLSLSSCQGACSRPDAMIQAASDFAATCAQEAIMEAFSKMGPKIFVNVFLIVYNFRNIAGVFLHALKVSPILKYATVVLGIRLKPKKKRKCCWFMKSGQMTGSQSAKTSRRN